MAISNVYADNGDLSVAKKPGVSTVHIDNMPEGGGAVESVNGQTGAVVLTASDVGALPDSTVIPDGVPTVTSSDDGKVLKATYSGGAGSYDWAAGGSSDVEYYTLAELGTKFPNGLNDVYAYISGGKSFIIRNGSLMYYLASCSSASNITFMKSPVKPTSDTTNEITFGLNVLSFNNNSYTLSYIAYMWSSSAYEPQTFAYYGHVNLYRPNETFVKDRVYRITDFSYVRYFVCILGFTADTYENITNDTTHFKEIRAYDELMLKANITDIPTLADLNTAGITDIQQVAALPATPDAHTLYLIPEA